MAEGVELVKAYVQLIPSMQGSESAIAAQLVPTAEKVGGDAGQKAGDQFGGKFKGVLAGALTVGAVAGAAKGLYEIGATFDDLADTIRIGTGATGEDLEGLIDVAKNVGRNVPVEFDAIGSTVADVNTRMGLTGDTLQHVASQYLNASRILGEDVDVMKTGAAFNAFKIEGENVADAMDHLFQVSQATGIGMNDLASTISVQAPALQNLGFSFNESAVMIGQFDKAGLNASALMGSMSKGLVTLAKDGEKPQEAFKRTVAEIEGFVKKGDEAAALDLASKVFGTRGATQFVGAIQAGALSLDDLAYAAGQTTDTINDVAGETDDFAEKWQLVKNNAALALEPLGSAVFDGLANALEWLMPYIESFGNWLADNQWAIAAIATIIGVVLVAAFYSWTASIWATTAALLASPITWIILAVVALVGALIWFFTQTELGQAIWEGFVDFLVAAWEWIVDAGVAIWEALSEFFSALWDGIKAGVNAAWEFIKTIISWHPLMLIINNWDTIREFLAEMWEKIKGFFSAAWDFIKELLGWTPLGMIVKNWGEILDWFKALPGKIGDFLSGVKDTLSAPFITAFNAIANMWNDTVGQLSFTAPDWIPGIGGKGWSAPKIPLLADGGVITEATLAVVGEAGPEAVIPLDRLNDYLSVSPVERAESVSINVGEMVVREEADIRRVAEELQRLMDRDRRAA